MVVTSRILQGMSWKEGVVQGCYEMRWCEVGGSVEEFVGMGVAVAAEKNPTLRECRMDHGLCGGEEVFVVVWGVGGYWIAGMKVRGAVLHIRVEFASAPSRIP